MNDDSPFSGSRPWRFRYIAAVLILPTIGMLIGLAISGVLADELADSFGIQDGVPRKGQRFGFVCLVLGCLLMGTGGTLGGLGGGFLTLLVIRKLLHWPADRAHWEVPRHWYQHYPEDASDEPIDTGGPMAADRTIRHGRLFRISMVPLFTVLFAYMCLLGLDRLMDPYSSWWSPYVFFLAALSTIFLVCLTLSEKIVMKADSIELWAHFKVTEIHRNDIDTVTCRAGSVFLDARDGTRFRVPACKSAVPLCHTIRSWLERSTKAD